LRIRAEPLRRPSADIFAAAGCAPGEAGRIAHHLVESNLTGHDSHGVIRIPRYLEWMGDGTLVPGQDVRVVAETEAMAVLDGGHGFGQTVGPQAVEIGIAKATRAGIAVLALRNAGHLGRIADWAEMAARAGLVSVHFVNVAGSVLVAPFGGAERRMSTSPFAAGVPMADGPPLILDFATSLVAEGKVMVAAKGGKPLPPGALVDADGTPSSDPLVLYGADGNPDSFHGRLGPGALAAMGGHKGSGLALLCELLGGALTGSGCAGPAKRPIANGMLSLYISAEAFGTDSFFAAEARAFLDFVRSARPDAPGGEVLLPGEPERRARERRLAEGIELPEDAWRAILAAARGAGLDEARIEAARAE
jgi:uncharacterized oxidoreductase